MADTWQFGNVMCQRRVKPPYAVAEIGVDAQKALLWYSCPAMEGGAGIGASGARGALPEEGRRRLGRVDAIFAGSTPEVGRDKEAELLRG